MLAALVIIVACGIFIAQRIVRILLRSNAARRNTRRPLPPKPEQHAFGKKKPDWVPKKIIRLKALMPKGTCRHITVVFNAKYKERGETVGKSYVSIVIKRFSVQIEVLRRKIKNRTTREGRKNHTWGGDFTFLPDTKHGFLGVIDHGTRSNIVLQEMPQRTTIAILRVLLDAIEQYGAPKFFRTDNERCFASPLLTLALKAIGVTHQLIDPHSPWQNGRIERFFWTLKEKLIPWWEEVGIPTDIQGDLNVFRAWYQNVRPHQGLAGLTPAQSWNGTTVGGHSRYFYAWNGLLAGFGPRI